VTDVLAALITYLQADTDVATEVGTRVFGGELPRDEIDDMPRKAVIIRLNGTKPGRSIEPSTMRSRAYPAKPAATCIYITRW